MTTTRHAKRTGLTLLELMIVLIILVMLFAIAGPRLLNTQRKADIKGTTVQIANLEAALKDYYLDMKGYPNTEEGLQALMRKPADEQKASRWAGPYLEADQLPSDAWGNPFMYEYPPTKGSGRMPNISSGGPDGDASTEEDNINNWHGSGTPEEGGEPGEEGDLPAEEPLPSDTAAPASP